MRFFFLSLQIYIFRRVNAKMKERTRQELLLILAKYFVNIFAVLIHEYGHYETFFICVSNLLKHI